MHNPLKIVPKEFKKKSKNYLTLRKLDTNYANSCINPFIVNLMEFKKKSKVMQIYAN